MIIDLKKIIENPELNQDINCCDEKGNNSLMQISSLILTYDFYCYRDKVVPDFKPYFDAIENLVSRGCLFSSNSVNKKPFHIAAFCRHTDFLLFLYNLNPELFSKQIHLEPFVSNFDVLHYLALKTNIDLVPAYYFKLLENNSFEKVEYILKVLEEKRKIFNYI